MKEDGLLRECGDAVRAPIDVRGHQRVDLQGYGLAFGRPSYHERGVVRQLPGVQECVCARIAVTGERCAVQPIARHQESRGLGMRPTETIVPAAELKVWIREILAEGEDVRNNAGDTCRTVHHG